MNFCVLAKISKRSVSFWYQSDGNAYAPLNRPESNEAPLYFYVNGNDFIFGAVARERSNRHDPNAYGNYFEIIKDPSKHFTIYGNKKPVKQLLYYGIEQYLSYFLNSVIYKTDSIESYRQHFPLRFLFDADINDNEKSLVESLFKEAGYFNLDRVHFNKILFSVLRQNGTLQAGKAILLLSAVDDVLYLNQYRDSDAEIITSHKLEGQGADPRVKILADMIVEYIVLQNSYLSIDRDAEIAFLLPYCASLLENITPIIKGDAELADGNKYWFKVSQTNLNDRLQYYSNDTMIYSAIDDLLRSASLKAEEVNILLGTEEISTTYFSNKLLKKYHHVKGVKETDIKDTLQAIFQEIANSNYGIRITAHVPPELPVNPMITRPPLPPPKLPPPLPPKKDISVSQRPAVIPKLPEVKAQETSNSIKPVKLPPLPPRKT